MKKIITLTICTILLFTGCSQSNTPRKISIAEQFGLAYAPVQIMKERGFLEDRLPEGVEVNWVQLINTAAIREAMISDNVDIGFMAIPPFLIGLDNGMEWKIATGLSASPLGLITNNPEIKSINDISPTDRIALPQPGSIQHILLSMAAEKEFGNAQKFDNQLVTLSHPDGMSALLSKGDVSLHFTSPPYYNKELANPEMSLVLSGKEAFGSDFSFIVGACLEDFYNDDKDLYNAFILALNDSIEFINFNTDEAAEILATQYNISVEETLEYVKSLNYTTTVMGTSSFSDFMFENNYIEKTYTDYDEFMFNGVTYEN